MMILHITSRSQWQQAHKNGEYRAPSLDTEGFIHCSRPEQILWVAHTFYSGQRDLLLLYIDPEQLKAELRYDEVEPGQHFPHLYGPLNLDAVVQVIPFEPNGQGQFELPQEENG